MDAGGAYPGNTSPPGSLYHTQDAADILQVQSFASLFALSPIKDYKVTDKIINHLKLTFKAERPPPPQAQRTWIIHGARLPQIRGTGYEAVIIHCESAVTK